MSKVHDFTKCLEYSQQLGDEAAWEDFYRRLWPDLVKAVPLEGKSRWQKDGIDRVLYLANGKEIYVDEKKRQPRKNSRGDLYSYDDFLCEVWSVAHHNPTTGHVVGKKVGWTLDPEKRCCLIAYAIPLLGKAYLLPFELLRITATENLETWKRESRPKYPIVARNEGYETINCAVTWDRVIGNMVQQMHRRFGSRLDLPIPEISEGGFAPIELFPEE